MSAQKTAVNEVDPDRKWLYRVGGISALVLGIAYIVIIAVYIPVGAPPTGEARLTDLAANAPAWWAILGLSVLTDLLFVPVMFALYFALKEFNRGMMLMATAWVALFVILDLAITWPNYASLIILSGDYTAATSDAQREFLVAAASYPSAVLDSLLLAVYIIVVPAVGFFMTSLVMLKGVFGKGLAYLGLFHSTLAIVSVVGPFFVSGLGVTIIIASALITVWVLLLGYRLYRLG